MGNEQSDRGESKAFNVIKCIPVIGQGYGLVRMAVYGGKHDTDRVAASFAGSFVAPFAPGVADHLEKMMIEDSAGVWKTPSELRNGGRLSPGDLIEFNCLTFGHYALYLGAGNVMNVKACGATATSARIEVKTIEEVCSWLKTNSVRIRRIHDQVAANFFEASPKSEDAIISAARRMEGMDVVYGFALRNCEYYVTLWRYGYGFSTQVARPTSTAFGVLVPGFSGITNVPLLTAELKAYTTYREISYEDRDKYY